MRVIQKSLVDTSPTCVCAGQGTAIDLDSGVLNNPRCLRPSGGSTDANALIEQYNCYPIFDIFDPNNPGKYRDPSQHWQTYDPGGNSTGAKWLINLESGKCVEDSAWGTANGVLLTQQDCVGAWKQYWFGL